MTERRRKPDIGALLSPASVAIIGAAPEGQGLRGRIVEILKAHPYEGRLYLISRSHAEVQGLKAYPSIADVAEVVELAVIIVPAQYVGTELERCGQAGVKAAIILSSGFAEEPGDIGRGLQEQIVAIAEKYGMAVNGPNSEGYANLNIALCPTFSPAVSPSDVPLLPAHFKGQVAVVAQSGGMGFAFFDRGRAKEMAFSHIITTGNEACLEVFDIVEHLIDEGKTDAFLLFLEDIKTPATFRRTAEKALIAGVPLIINKIGKSEAGARAAASHTAAMAGSYSAFQAMAERYCLIEGASLEEMVDIAQGFIAWKNRLPAGRRVGICTASGGGGGWAADVCLGHGLEVPLLDAKTRAGIDAVLPAYGTSQNPVDGTAQTIRKIGYGGLTELVLPSPEIDAILVVMSGRATEYLEHEREKLVRLAAGSPKPIMMWSYTLPSAASTKILATAGLPMFTNMQHAVTALRHMTDWRQRRERILASASVKVTQTHNSTRTATAAHLESAPKVMTEAQAKPLLAAYGIGSDRDDRLVTSRDAAIAAAKQFGRPVALKVQSPDILHKSDVGALALNLVGEAHVGQAYDRILADARQFVPHARIDGILVQPMAPRGREVIAGISTDPTFGPMLMLGFGGIHVEILKDVVFAPVPLSLDDAHALIARLKGAALLDAVRGSPAADRQALATLLEALGRFASDHADAVAEIDLNPIIVHDAGAGLTVADALIIKHTRN